MLKAKISIVIGTYNRKKMLINCIESIRNNGITVPYESIVIDGGSDDGTLQWLMQQKDIITIVHHNRTTKDGQMVMKKSWGYFMNLGFKSAEGEYICMLSDDCYIHPKAIINGYEIMESGRKNDRIGGCAFYCRDCLINDKFSVSTALDKVYINNGFYRKDILKEIDWIDGEAFRFYLADIDLSLRIWDHGYRIVTSQNSLVEHLHHATDNIKTRNIKLSLDSDILNFKKKWKEKLNKSNPDQIVGEIVLENNIPNKTNDYVPQCIFFKILLLEKRLKKAINEKHWLYPIFKKLKWMLLGK